MDPSLRIEPIDLQQFGLVALSATAGAASLLLRDNSPWLAATSPRTMAWPRLAWIAASLLGYLALGALTTPLLPAGVPPVGAYLSIALLWWGIATLAATYVGRLAGLLLPLSLAVFATAKILPWNYNIIFNPALAHVLSTTTLALVAVSAACYVIHGSRRITTVEHD